MIKLILALLNLLRLWKRVKPAEQHEHVVAGPDAAPSPTKPRLKVVHKKPDPDKDWLRRPGETAAEWLERTTTNH